MSQQDFEATDDGFVAKHLVEPGHAPVSVGSPIMIIVEDEDDVGAFANADPSEFAAPASGGAANDSPAAATETVSAAPPVSAPTPVATSSSTACESTGR